MILDFILIYHKELQNLNFLNFVTFEFIALLSFL